MKALSICFGIILLGAFTLQSQTVEKNYEHYFSQGVEKYEAEEYRDATVLFKAAEISTNQPGLQRQALLMVIKSDSAYVQALQEAREDALEQRDSVTALQELANVAQLNAQKEKRFSEAIYLAFIAEQEVIDNQNPALDRNDSVAMQLAYEAIRHIAEDTNYVESVHGVFGRAAYKATRTINNTLHRRAVIKMDFIDQNHLLTAGRDSLIVLSNMKDSDHTVVRADHFLQDVFAADNGRYLLYVTTPDNRVHIRNRSNGLTESLPMPGRVNKVLFDPDTQWLCVAVQNEKLRFINLRDNSDVYVDHGNSWARDLVFSPDSTRILSRGADGHVGVWNVDGSVHTPVFLAHEKYIYGAQFSPDGNSLLTNSADQTARIWDLEGRLQRTLEGHQHPVFKAEYSRDGSYILTHSVGQDVCIWTGTGAPVRCFLPGQSGIPDIKEVTWHPDDKSVLAISGNKVYRINLEGFVTQRFDHEQPVYSIELSDDGQLMITYGYDESARMWDLRPNSYVAEDSQGHLLMDIELEGSEEISSVSFSPDGRTVMVGMTNGAVQMIPTPATTIAHLETNPINIAGYLISNNILFLEH